MVKVARGQGGPGRAGTTGPERTPRRGRFRPGAPLTSGASLEAGGCSVCYVFVCSVLLCSGMFVFCYVWYVLLCFVMFVMCCCVFVYVYVCQ